MSMNESFSTNSSAQDSSAGSAAAALDLVLRDIEGAFAAAEYARTHELMNEYLLETWFGILPEQLLKMLLAMEAEGIKLSATLTAIRAMVMIASTTPEHGEFGNQDFDSFMKAAAGSAGSASPTPATLSTPIASSVFAPDPEQPAQALHLSAQTSDAATVTKLVTEIARSYNLRFVGRPVDAFKLSESTKLNEGVFQGLFSTKGGTGLFVTLQQALTAMLAGELKAAETKLAEAKLLASGPTLPFLTRDAYSKSAVLHACFGDPAVAAAEIAMADSVPRTNSWLEPVLDAQTDLARVLLQTDSPEDAVKQLDMIPLNALGEMWPFYAYALHTVLMRAGQSAEANRRLEILDQTRLPRIDGQGLTGSILPSLLAFDALASGNFVRARELWERTDPDVVMSRLGGAALSLATGDARAAIQMTMEVRGQTRTLRQLEIWRLGLLTAGLLLMGDEDGCIEALRTALALPRGLSVAESAVFHERVQEFAIKHLPEWPSSKPELLDTVSKLSLEFKGVLTSRELEVLEGLSRGLTRDQIARELFLSVNTVKAHQQSLYRKLEVSSKQAAVFEGDRRGLI